MANPIRARSSLPLLPQRHNAKHVRFYDSSSELPVTLLTAGCVYCCQECQLHLGSPFSTLGVCTAFRSANGSFSSSSSSSSLSGGGGARCREDLDCADGLGGALGRGGCAGGVGSMLKPEKESLGAIVSAESLPLALSVATVIAFSRFVLTSKACFQGMDDLLR
jgi:hypothetical protein